MTRNQQWLLDAAREALAYFDKREKGEPTIGVSDPVWIGRMLRESINAVETEARLQGAWPLAASSGVLPSQGA